MHCFKEDLSFEYQTYEFDAFQKVERKLTIGSSPKCQMRFLNQDLIDKVQCSIDIGRSIKTVQCMSDGFPTGIRLKGGAKFSQNQRARLQEGNLIIFGRCYGFIVRKVDNPNHILQFEWKTFLDGASPLYFEKQVSTIDDPRKVFRIGRPGGEGEERPDKGVENKSVFSRKHAEIKYDQMEGFYIEDVGSGQGTIICLKTWEQKEKKEPSGVFPLLPGMEICIGIYTFTVPGAPFEGQYLPLDFENANRKSDPFLI